MITQNDTYETELLWQIGSASSTRYLTTQTLFTYLRKHTNPKRKTKISDFSKFLKNIYKWTPHPHTKASRCTHCGN